MGFLNDYFVFQTIHFRGDVENGSLVTNRNASRRPQRKRRSSARGDQSSFAVKAVRKILTGSIQQFIYIHRTRCRQFHCRPHFMRHGRGRESGVRPRRVDEGYHTELLIVVHSFR